MTGKAGASALVTLVALIGSPALPVRALQGPQRSVVASAGNGSIQGRVFDVDSGNPIRRAQVSLGGTPASDPPPIVLTNDQGEFTFNNLPAGRYSLSASKVGYASLSYGQRRPGETGKPLELTNGQRLSGNDFHLPRGAVIVVRISDDIGDPKPDVEVRAQQYRFVNGGRELVTMARGATDVTGESRLFGLLPGTYYVSAGTDAPNSIMPADNRSVYAVTYHPGTALSSEAQPIALRIGDEVQVSYSLARVRPARVTGTVKTSDGKAFVGLRMSINRIEAVNSTSRALTSRPDGGFSLANVLPGNYLIDAWPASAATGTQEYASIPITVSGDDITVPITTSRGGSVHGRFAFDTTSAGLRPGTVTISAVPTVQRTGAIGRTSASTTDWTFDAVGLTGPTWFKLASSAGRQGGLAGWYLKAIMLDGKDVTDAPLDFAGDREVQNLQVVLTQKQTTVTGTAIDSQGEKATDYVAILFSQDRALRTAQSRFIAAGHSDQVGEFKIAGLPPGRYLAAAIDYLSPGEERDPALLDRLEQQATPVTISDAHTTPALRVVSY